MIGFLYGSAMAVTNAALYAFGREWPNAVAAVACEAIGVASLVCERRAS